MKVNPSLNRDELDPISAARTALVAIEAALDSLVWKPLPCPESGESFTATNAEMTILVLKGEYESQALYVSVATMNPGIVTPGTLIINVPPELAKKAFEIAYAYYQRSIAGESWSDSFGS